jgi:hypothetical protein
MRNRLQLGTGTVCMSSHHMESIARLIFATNGESKYGRHVPCEEVATSWLQCPFFTFTQLLEACTKQMSPCLRSGMEWCAGVVHKLKQTRDNRHLWLTAETTLPSVIQKSWGLAADADADAGVHFDAAPYLQHQQIVDQKLVTHAKGVQDGHVCHLL